MARLPDRFDLWVRQARACVDPARQADYVLGALAGLTDWHFLNVGTGDQPRPAETEIEGARFLLIFSDHGRIEELVRDAGTFDPAQPLPIISIPVSEAMTWCLNRQAEGYAGLLVNPGEDAVVIPLDQLAAFHMEWIQRGARQASGFWIPNLTNEEEDFWQEHGL
jgi:hypothetical protein